MSLISVVLLIVACGVWWLGNWRRQDSNKKHPPGPVGLPFIGSYFYLLWLDFYRPHIAMLKLKNFYKSPVISFSLGKYHTVVANTYDTCKEILTNPDIQGRSLAYSDFVRTFGGKYGFFNDDGDSLFLKRRSALRSLRDLGFGRRSDDFENVIAEEVQNLIESLHETKGKDTLIPEAFYHTILNLINHILHGFRFPPEQRKVLTDLGKSTLRISTSTDITGRLIAIWPWIRFFFPVLSGNQELLEASQGLKTYIKDSYNRHMADFDNEMVRDMMDYFIKYREILPNCTDEEIWSSIMDLTFPNVGSSVTCSFTLGYISEQPKLMKKCQQQIDEVVGKGRLPNLNDRQNLPLIEACIRETIRINPLAPLGVGHRATTDTTLGGFFVPKDTFVIGNVYAMHHDPELWTDPEVYRPERFTVDGVKDKTLSFGLGKRVCAGETYVRQNLFVIVAAILQNFDVELVTPIDPLKFVNGGAVITPPDFAMRFKPRA